MSRATPLALLTIVAVGVAARAADVAERTLFQAGEGGYHTYRIPSLIVAKSGVVLAFCEGRKNGRGDTGDIDLVLRRSIDGGKTWGKLQIVWDEADNTCGNPCPVIDQRTGTIWLLMTHNLREDTEAKIVAGTSKGSRTIWITKSNDDGATWAKPVEITRDVKKPEWTWYATGPGVGIQLKSGRLLIPCDNKADGGKLRQSHVIYSDDAGKSWKLGGVVGPGCNESQAVELSDGRVMLNMRSYERNKLRVVATSNDRGATFTEVTEDPVLIEPVCQASIVRHPGEKGGILFSNPASGKRERMTVRLSTDDAKTWPHSRVLFEGPAAYSCLTVLPDKSIGCLYERGEKSPYEQIVLAHFLLEWVAAGK
jgi:sialidase-1